LLTAFLIGIGAMALPAMNLVIDPYSIFGTGFLPDGAMSNERWNKLRHVLANPKRYETFVLGTSVSGAYPPHVYQAFTPGRTIYNLSAFNLAPHEMVDILDQLELRGVRPKELIIALDPFAFSKKPPGASGQMLLPKMDGAFKTHVAWYSEYLFAPSLHHAFHKILSAGVSPRPVEFDFEGGAYYLNRREQAILENPGAYIQKNLQGEPPHFEPWDTNSFSGLPRLRDWADKRGIKTTWYIHPMHKLAISGLGNERLRQFKGRLSEILGTQLLDLSRLPTVCDDDAQWYDERHYRPDAAKLVIDAISASKIANHGAMYFDATTKSRQPPGFTPPSSKHLHLQ